MIKLPLNNFLIKFINLRIFSLNYLLLSVFKTFYSKWNSYLSKIFLSEFLNIQIKNQNKTKIPKNI